MTMRLAPDMAREVESGTPFNVAFARRCAKRAGSLPFVREALKRPQRTKARATSAPPITAAIACCVLSDLIQLRSDMSDFEDVNPFDVAFVEAPSCHRAADCGDCPIVLIPQPRPKPTACSGGRI